MWILVWLQKEAATSSCTEHTVTQWATEDRLRAFPMETFSNGLFPRRTCQNKSGKYFYLTCRVAGLLHQKKMNKKQRRSKMELRCWQSLDGGATTMTSLKKASPAIAEIRPPGSSAGKERDRGRKKKPQTRSARLSGAESRTAAPPPPSLSAAWRLNIPPGRRSYENIDRSRSR